MTNIELNKTRANTSSNSEIRHKVIDLAWPAFTEMLLVNLISMISMIMVSRVSPEAVAAVALTNQPILLVIAIFSAINVGATILVSRAIGGNNTSESNQAAQIAFNVNLYCMLPLTLIFTLFAETVLGWMGASPAVISEGLIYARLLFLSLGLMLLTSGLSAVLRGAGDTKTSAKINVIANIIIVIVGVPLIYGWFGLPALGVTGAGIATLFARILATVWMLMGVLNGKKLVLIKFSQLFYFEVSLIRRMLHVGIPAALETLIIRGSMIFLNVVLAYLGATVLAANQIAFNILGLSWLPSIAFATAATTLVSQGLGAKEVNLAAKYGWATNKYAMYFSFVIGLIFIFFSEWILLLYTTDPEVIRQASIVLKIIGVTQIFQAAQYVLAGALRGAGDTKYNMKVALWGVIIFRIVLTSLFIFIFNWGLIGAWLALALDQIFRSTLFAIRFRKGAWKEIVV